MDTLKPEDLKNNARLNKTLKPEKTEKPEQTDDAESTIDKKAMMRGAMAAGAIALGGSGVVAAAQSLGTDAPADDEPAGVDYEIEDSETVLARAAAPAPTRHVAQTHEINVVPSDRNTTSSEIGDVPVDEPADEPQDEVPAEESEDEPEENLGDDSEEFAPELGEKPAGNDEEAVDEEAFEENDDDDYIEIEDIDDIIIDDPDDIDPEEIIIEENEEMPTGDLSGEDIDYGDTGYILDDPMDL